MLNPKADGESCFWWLCALVLATSAIFQVITTFKMYLKEGGDKLKRWKE